MKLIFFFAYKFTLLMKLNLFLLCVDIFIFIFVIMGKKNSINFFEKNEDCIFIYLFIFQCTDFVKAGAEQGLTPSDVVLAADITFSCVADPQAAKDVSIVRSSGKIEIAVVKVFLIV